MTVNLPETTAPLSARDAIYDHIVPAERPWSRLIRRGQTVRVIDSEGQQAIDALLYRADDPI
jgi:uncharacterized protein YcgI (DUF1989 family)